MNNTNVNHKVYDNPTNFDNETNRNKFLYQNTDTINALLLVQHHTNKPQPVIDRLLFIYNCGGKQH